MEMVKLFDLDEEDLSVVHDLVRKHAVYTDSERSRQVLAAWDEMAAKFVKVYPNDYRRVIETQKHFKAQGLSDEDAIMAAFAENATSTARVGGAIVGRPSLPWISTEEDAMMAAFNALQFGHDSKVVEGCECGT